MPKKKKYVKGGELKGKSHAEGGIPGKIKGSDQPLEFEGGEVVINTSVNEAAQKHGKGLLALNENPDDYEIVKKDSILPYEFGGEIPIIDARTRKGKK
jgi:hypothetical protein